MITHHRRHAGHSSPHTSRFISSSAVLRHLPVLPWQPVPQPASDLVVCRAACPDIRPSPSPCRRCCRHLRVAPQSADSTDSPDLTQCVTHGVESRSVDQSRVLSCSRICPFSPPCGGRSLATWPLASSACAGPWRRPPRLTTTTSLTRTPPKAHPASRSRAHRERARSPS